jgi:fluoride ion exporter CrcB/FEX
LALLAATLILTLYQRSLLAPWAWGPVFVEIMLAFTIGLAVRLRRIRRWQDVHRIKKHFRTGVAAGIFTFASASSNEAGETVENLDQVTARPAECRSVWKSRLRGRLASPLLRCRRML